MLDHSVTELRDECYVMWCIFSPGINDISKFTKTDEFVLATKLLICDIYTVNIPGLKDKSKMMVKVSQYYIYVFCVCVIARI